MSCIFFLTSSLISQKIALWYTQWRVAHKFERKENTEKVLKVSALCRFETASPLLPRVLCVLMQRGYPYIRCIIRPLIPQKNFFYWIFPFPPLLRRSLLIGRTVVGRKIQYVGKLSTASIIRVVAYFCALLFVCTVTNASMTCAV